MDPLRAADILVTLGGLGASAPGVVATYPGRGFSIAAIMVGLTLLAIGGAL